VDERIIRIRAITKKMSSVSKTTVSTTADLVDFRLSGNSSTTKFMADIRLMGDSHSEFEPRLLKPLHFGTLEANFADRCISNAK
jgi:hypothetical protein